MKFKSDENEVDFFMLLALCGNQNVQKILIFLFVNGKCYGTQLSRFLKTPLTPLQKALLRLEKGELIMSYYEGKTRIYQFNPSFPLLAELEQLLRKAYTLLPSHEKKNYYLAKEEIQPIHSARQTHFQTVRILWEKLKAVKQLTFHAKTNLKQTHGWNRKGKGDVTVKKEGEHTLIFTEKGTWQGNENKEVSFTNIFRWTLDKNTEMISLEHLRYGQEQPVFLFNLAPSSKYALSSVDSHLCGGDTYFGQIQFHRHILRLSWRVIGPKKNEEIDYYYY